MFDVVYPQVSRIDGTMESYPCLKVTQKSFGSQNSSTDITFYRLSMPIECAETFSASLGGGAPAYVFPPKKVIRNTTATVSPRVNPQEGESFMCVCVFCVLVNKCVS